MKWQSLLKDYYLAIAFALSLALLAVSFGIIYEGLKEADGFLIIHFTRLGGIDFLGQQKDVFSILFAAIAVLLINFLLAIVFYDKYRFFSYFIGFFSVFYCVLILIAAAAIISVN
ncbi:MAG TPA: hypothetical protein VJB92_03275 [Candidatus Paceibacterota bacterium]